MELVVAIEITSEEEALDVLNNPTGDYFLGFPVSIVKISTGETITFENIFEYNEFLEDCL